MITPWRIDKSRIEIPFTAVPNRILEDEELSWRAKGLWSWLSGRPDGWTTNVELMTRQGKEGRDAVRKALSELEESGYLIREAIKDRRGRRIGTNYVLVCDCGFSASTHQGKPIDKGFETPVDGGKPSSGKPTEGNQDLESLPPNKKEKQEGLSKKDQDFQDFLSKLQEDWNAMAATHGLPGFREWTDTRKRAARARFKESGFREVWNEALWSLHDDPWMMGRNERKWKANITWFLRPDKLVDWYDGHKAKMKRSATSGRAVRTTDQEEFSL